MESRIDIILSNGDKAGETLKELTKQANKLNKEIKDLKPGTDEFVAKAKDLEVVGDKIGGIKDQIKGTTQASNGLKDSVAQNIPLFNKFGQAGQQFTTLKSGVGGLTSSFGILKGAIAATGIGLLVIAFATLYTWFKKTDDGATMLDGIFRAIGAVVNVLINKVLDFGHFLSEAFQNPKQALTDLVNFIGNNVLNRFKAFKVMFDALLDFDFKKLGDGFIQLQTGIEGASDKAIALGKEMAEAAKKAYDLALVFDELDERERNNKVLTSELTTQIDKLLISSKNRTLAEKERMNLLDEASAKEKYSFELNEKYEKDKLKAIIEEARLTTKLTEKEFNEYLDLNLHQKTLDDNKLARLELLSKKTAQLSDDDLTKVRDQQTKINDLTTDSSNLQEKIINRRAALQDEFDKSEEKHAAAAKKRSDDKIAALKKQYEEEAAAAKNIEDIKLALEEEGLQKDIDKINLETKRKIEAIKGTDAQIMDQALLLEALQAKEIQAVKDKYAKEAEEKDKKIKADELARQKKSFDDKVAAIDLQTSIELNGLNEKHLAGVLSEADYIGQIQKLGIDGEQQKLALIKAAHGVESKEFQDQYSKILGLQKVANDNFLRATDTLNKQLTESFNGTLNVFANLFGTLASQYEQGTEQYKAFATAQAVISTIQGAVNAYTSALAIPYVGEVLAPIAAGAALAAGYAQVQKIENTKMAAPVRAETGGLLTGKRHTEGGIDVNAEDGEFIFSRNAVKNIGADKLMKMNSQFSKRRMQTTGPVNPFQNRPPISSSKSNSSGSSSDNSQDLKGYIEQLVAAQDRRMDRIKVVNVMTAPDKSGYKDKIDVLNKIKDDANV